MYGALSMRLAFFLNLNCLFMSTIDMVYLTLIPTIEMTACSSSIKRDREREREREGEGEGEGGR